MNNDIFDICGRVICITGGLGQLGQQFTGELVKRGAKVAILDLPESAEEVLTPYNDVQDSVLYISVDITNKKSIEKSLNTVISHWGVPHAIINNAALDSPPGSPAEENGPFETYPEESWDKVMEVNAKGVFLTSQIFGGAMAKEGRGVIINICSTYGLVSPNQNIYEYRRKNGEEFYKPVAYSASKSALLNLSRYLATYFAPKGVRVNLISPGGVFNDQDEEFLKEYCPKVPMERMANADEYNGAIVFLVSDASSYMTGSNLVIDGGWTAW